jgi:hypothetical protein
MSAGPSHQREQQERRAVLANDRKLRPGDYEPSTLHEMANLGIDTDISSGRSKGDYVSGSEKATNYPAIPSGPWSSDYARLPDELPLGVAIDAQEPNGTFAEIAASLPAPLTGKVEGDCAVAPVATSSTTSSTAISASAERDQAPEGVQAAHNTVRGSLHPNLHRPTRRL